MRNPRWSMALLLIVFVGVARGEALSLKAAVSESPRGPILVMTMKNTSGRSIRIDRSKLPWGGRYNMTVIAVDPRESSSLKPSFPIDDTFVDNEVSIKSGQVLKGAIDLDLYIEQLEESLKSHDLLLFWFFDAAEVTGQDLGAYGGWVKIKRKG